MSAVRKDSNGVRGLWATMALMFTIAFSGAAQGSTAAGAARELLRDTFGHLGDSIEVELLPTRHDLDRCSNPQPFLKSSRVNRSGRLFVGLECGGSRHGAIYVPAQIRLTGHYLVARKYVPAGSVIDASMLEMREGDITALLGTGVFDLDEAVGLEAGRGLSTGAVVRRQHLREVQMIERGDPVSFELVGSGFRIAGKGEALQSGNPGDRVRLRTEQRKTLAGIITRRGVVRVQP